MNIIYSRLWYFHTETNTFVLKSYINRSWGEVVKILSLRCYKKKISEKLNSLDPNKTK